MILHVDLSWILEVARRSGHGDPAVDDYGVPASAVPVAHGYLTASGLDAKVDQDKVTALATELTRQESTAASVTDILRTWTR